MWVAPGTRAHREATGPLKSGVDSGFWVSFVHHSPPNPPRSPDPPRKEPRMGLRGLEGEGRSPRAFGCGGRQDAVGGYLLAAVLARCVPERAPERLGQRGLVLVPDQTGDLAHSHVRAGQVA